MDPDPDPGQETQKHVDPVDPDSDPDLHLSQKIHRVLQKLFGYLYDDNYEFSF
jgi:hypothetical protein